MGFGLRATGYGLRATDSEKRETDNEYPPTPIKNDTEQGTIPEPDQAANNQFVPMSDHDNDEDPHRLFQQAMQGVQPIKSKKRHDQQRRPSADIPQSTLNTRRSAAQRTESGGGAALSEAWVEPVDPEQRIDFSRPGLQQTRLRQLRQGMIPVRYQLDLHGYKIEEARELISEFLYFCKTQGYACVRIIHGKSHRSTDRQNTLKSHVNHWLRQIPDVLAFCSAPPSEGGTGSVLVLIRKK